MNNVEITCSQGRLEILHSVAKRVRLRAKDTKTKEQLPQIAQHLRNQVGIETVRINKETGSLTIFSESGQLCEEYLKTLLQPFEVIISEKSSTPSESETSPRVWDRLYGFIPSIVGLIAIKGLGISGWQALIAYLVATGAMREGMEQLSALGSSSEDGDRDRAKTQKSRRPEKGKPTRAEQPLKSSEPSYEIVHQIPGRIRLKIPSLKKDRELIAKLENLTRWDNRITSVRVNPTTASVTIYYHTQMSADRKRVPLEASTFIELIEWIRTDKPAENGHRQREMSLKEMLNAQYADLSRADSPIVESDRALRNGDRDRPNVEEDLLSEPNSTAPSFEEDEDDNDGDGENASRLSPLTHESFEEDGNDRDGDEENAAIPSPMQGCDRTFNGLEPVSGALTESPEQEKPIAKKDTLSGRLRRWKSSALNSMLALMANLPVQNA
ncbi:MAG: HMA2 domain-containing protein [Spirulina sp.]